MHASLRRFTATPSRTRLVITIMALATGCSTQPLPDPGAPDFAVLGDGAGPTADLAVSCPNVFPVFDKSCSHEADCFIAFHMINCCGDLAIGYNISAQSAFSAAEKTCEAMYPACGCAAPTKAEDGRTQVQGEIMVRCSTGTCNTYVP